MKTRGPDKKKRAPMSAEEREKRSVALKGRRLTDEHKKKISEFQKERVRRPHTEETRQKMSASHRRNRPTPEEGHVYGPYPLEDGRKIVSLLRDGEWVTTPYARYLVEQSLQRRLTPDEEVHHSDFDRTHDTLENLEVLSKSEHQEIHRKSSKTL